MTYPSLRDWLFSGKTFAASMLALYLGLYFQLPRPYWAMASVHRVEPVRRRNALEGAVSRARHRARRRRRDLLRATVRRDAAAVRDHRRHGAARCSTSRSPIAPRALRVHARRLHDAARRTADRDRSVHRVRRRDRAYRGDRARHRVRERGRQRDLPEPARADADRAHRRVVQGRRVLRPRDAVRAHCRQALSACRHASRRPSRASNSC